MSLHVYTPMSDEPVKFYDTSSKDRFEAFVHDVGALIITLIHLDTPDEVVAIFSEQEWDKVFDVNYDPLV